MMDHRDHLNLLRGAVPAEGGLWAEFGSGRGAFTLALGELIGPTGTIYSVDKDRKALREQSLTMQALLPQLKVHYISEDFTQPLNLPPLDGIVIANALHFFTPDQKPVVVRHLKKYLRPHGLFVLIEYNADQGNLWVPSPLPYPGWEALARECGFVHTRLLATVSSRLWKEFYSAESWE